MKGLLFRILPAIAGLLLLVLGIAVALPFTESGSRLLLNSVSRILPVQVEYAGGSLMRGVQLSRVQLETEAVSVDVRDIDTALDISCLWNSRFCFDHLAAESVEVVWDGGRWTSAKILAQLSIQGSRIVVDTLETADALLTLSDQSQPRAESGDSSIKLPIELLVLDAQLDRVAWDIYGKRYQHDSITFRGQWLGYLLELDRVELIDKDLGALQLGGELDFSGDWPFELAATADWKANLSLVGVIDRFFPALRSSTDGFPAISLLSPWHASVTGTRVDQSLSIESAISGLGYQALQLSFSAHHSVLLTEEQGAPLFVFDRINLRDKATNSELSGSGELLIDEHSSWTLSARSDGFSLPALSDEIAGRFAGSFEAGGTFADERWDVSLTEIDLAGDINDLPVGLEGRVGVNQGLLFAGTSLAVDFNGARLQLDSPLAAKEALDIQLHVAEIGRWLADSLGSLTLTATLAENFSTAAVTASVQGFQWQDIAFKQGEASGQLALTNDHTFDLTTVISGAALNTLKIDRVSLRAAGNEHRQTLQLESSGGIEARLTGSGEFSLAESRGEMALEGELSSLAALMAEDYDISSQLKLTLSTDWSPGSDFEMSGEVQLLQPELRRTISEAQFATVAWDRAGVRFSRQGEKLRLNVSGVKNKQEILALNLILPGREDQALSGELIIQQLDIANLQPFVPMVSNLQGVVNGAVKLSGTGRQVLGRGEIALLDSGFSVVDSPTVVEALQLKIQVQGDTAAVQGDLLLGGGKLNITGNLGYSPEAFVELRLLGERETLLFPPSAQMLVSHDINLTATPDHLDISGKLVVHEGKLEHEELPAEGVALSEDVVIVGYVGPQPRPFDLSMDVQVVIEDQFKVVGSVIDVTVGGELQLLQKRGHPLQLFGNLNVIGGELRAYNQHLKVKRGTVAFSGATDNPVLDMRADRVITNENITVGIELRGTLEEPVLEVFSNPVLPSTEALSYLVRGRGLDAGAGADGTALAISMGASIVNQTGVLRKLDKVPGIRGVEIGAEGTDDDTTATVSGYIGNRIYLSYGVGLYEPINVLTARLYLQTRLWLEVVSSLENSLDLYYSFDIE